MTLLGMEIKPCTVRSDPYPAGGPGCAADANPMAPMEVKPCTVRCKPNPGSGLGSAADAISMAPYMSLLMPDWTGNRTRAAFVEFYETKAHTYWKSCPVVPHNDPTLLFINAGMNQYKPIFLGVVDPNSDMGKLTRACNSQKCIRAVKHNFNMGKLTRACNSQKCIRAAISDSCILKQGLLVDEEAKGLPVDEEAKAIWLQFLPAERVLPFGCEENFWEMGDQGPCGPCTEIHFDRVGGRDAGHLVNSDDPNVLEIWNVVFIEFNREADGSLIPLPAKHVDTGMGLERITSIGADDTDGVDMAYRVVADHIRTLSFSIADGARPGNEGRDFVLRRILRRAVRYGREKLGAQEGFFAQCNDMVVDNYGPAFPELCVEVVVDNYGPAFPELCVDVVVDNYGPAFPELVSARDTIQATIREEEISFSRTLVKGVEKFKKAAAAAKDGILAGEDVFQLSRKQGVSPRAASKKTTHGALKFEAEATGWLQAKAIPLTNDEFKYSPADVEVTVLAILSPSGYVQSTSEHAEGPFGLVLDKTTFYAESGYVESTREHAEGPFGLVLDKTTFCAEPGQ
eukprot:gene16394-22596_t